MEGLEGLEGFMSIFACAHARAPAPTSQYHAHPSDPSEPAQIRAFSLPGTFRHPSEPEASGGEIVIVVIRGAQPSSIRIMLDHAALIVDEVRHGLDQFQV